MDKLLFWLGLGAAQKGAGSKEVHASRHWVVSLVVGILIAVLIGADLARPPIDFRFRWKSGRAANITSKAGFDPTATWTDLFCCYAEARFMIPRCAKVSTSA